MDERFDAVIIGAGIAGETCARRLNAGGLRVAIVERDDVGGECAFWGRIPSQTLLGPASTLWRAQQIAGIHFPGDGQAPDPRRSQSPVSTPDDRLEVEALGEAGMALIRGDARIVEPGRIRVGERVIEATCIVIATGSTPRIPRVPGLADVDFWTNREAFRYQSIPQQVLLLGGEPQSVELAQMFRMYGAQVTLLTADRHLILQEDPEIGSQMASHLQRTGVRVVLGQEPVEVARDAEGEYIATLANQTAIRAQALVVADSRRPRTEVLEAAAIGVRVGDNGILIDGQCRAAEGIWAIGDVTGVLPLSHLAQYQAHLAADDILGHPHPARYLSVPRLYFTDPQIAATGLTIEQADEQQIELTSAILDLEPPASSLPAHSATDAPAKLALYADRRSGVLAGAWVMGPDAADWIKLAVLGISAAMPLTVLYDTVEQYPAFGEPYRMAFEQLISQLASSYP
ncbi:MAG: dihydrolipoyl dehydrogenase family protein [Ktedonobacterales bacterium]